MAEFLDFQKGEMSFWVITIVFEYIFAYYFIRQSLNRKDVPRNFNLAAGIMFLGIALTYTLRILNDYYDMFLHNNVLMFVSNIPFVLGTLPVVLYLEKNIIQKTKYIISSMFLISSIIFIFMSIFSNFQPSTIEFWVAPPTGIGALVPSLIYLYMMIKSTGIIRRSSFFICAGIVLLSLPIFVFMGVPISPIIIPLASLIGCLFLAKGFFGYPVELKWQEKLKEIYAITETGVCLYAFFFEKNIPLEDSDLKAGGFAGIQLLLSEIIGTNEPLQLIDYKNMKIMLDQSSNVVFVLILKENSHFLQYKLRLFSQEFQNLFYETLQQWNGNIDLFKPTRSLIQRIFELGENIM